MGSQDLYKVLGVDKDVSQQELEKQYKARSTKVCTSTAGSGCAECVGLQLLAVATNTLCSPEELCAAC